MIKRGKPAQRKIQSLSKDKIIDFAANLVEISKKPNKNREKSIFSSYASSSVAGGRDQCINPRCRLEHLDNLSRFAVLFSDKIYIYNFFQDFAHFQNVEKDKVRFEFYNDLSIMNHIKPLIDKGFISFLTPAVEHICPHCQSIAYEKFFEKETCDKIKMAADKLIKIVFDNLKITLEKAGEYSKFSVVGSEDYLEHGRRIFFSERKGIPDPLKNHPRLINTFEKNGKLHLSKTMMKKFHLHNDIAGSIYKNASYQLFASQVIGASFLTGRKGELDILKTITGDPFYEHRNTIIQKHIDIILPFLDNVSLNNLIKLRNREGDSLIEFRKSISNAVDQTINVSKSFSEKDAKAIYNDIILPKLSSMNKRVKNAQKDLITEPIRTITATTGALTFGFYTGVIPTELFGIAKALGLTKIASDIVKQIMSLGDAYKAIRNDELYFLWKLKKLKGK